MRKKLLFAVAFAFFMAMAVYSPREASAIPAFARQTGFACSTCHYQHFPELNAFGRQFKAGGFTMVGGQSLIEGEGLSLPSVLNATIMTKTQYNITYGDHTGSPQASDYDNGTWDFPQDASIFLAGRAGEHVGFLTEVSLMSGDTERTVSFKIPFVFDVYDTKLLVEPYTTDGAGPSWSFETLNTGITETHTPLLQKAETSAPQYIGVGMPATGVAFVAYKPWGYINYSLWSCGLNGGNPGTPDSCDHSVFNGGHTHIATPFHYIRVAATPNIAGWDLGLGFAGWFGRASDSFGGTLTGARANAWAVDAQAQGNVMNFPIGVYTAFASAGKTTAADVAANKENIFNDGAKNKTAWSILGEFGIIPNKLAASAGYRLGHNGDPNGIGENTTDDAATLALTYSPALNIQFSIDHSWYSGSGSRSGESADGWDAPTGPGQLTTITMWTVF